MAQFIELNLDQGADFSFDMTITNDDGTAKNVSGYTFASSMKKSYYSSNVAANLTATIMNSSNGLVRFAITAANNSSIKAGRYLFDIKQTDGSNNITRIVEGLITVNPGITA
jgi:hypothetical protein